MSCLFNSEDIHSGCVEALRFKQAMSFHAETRDLASGSMFSTFALYKAHFDNKI